MNKDKESIHLVLEMLTQDYMEIFDDEALSEQPPDFWPKMLHGAKLLCEANDYPCPEWIADKTKTLEA